MHSTTGSTAADSVVVRRVPPRRPVIAAISIVFASVFLYSAFSFEMPYYAISPGSAVDTSMLVHVDPSHDHPAKGVVLLTTVSLGKVTLLQAIEGWLDPAVDVVAQKVIAPPDVDEQQFRQLNLEAMDESKQKAIGVAFEALGVDAIRGKGAEIVQVVDDTPAAPILAVGDVVVGIDGAAVSVDADAVSRISSHKPGERARLSVIGKDGGPARDIEVTLAEHPDVKGRAFLGVSLTTKDVSFEFPFDVDLKSEQIGGPSAGLAFTLAVIDALTEGELTGGTRVAATGTIELDGSVGEVGGVAQKTIAVKRSGATLFMVPSAEYERAKRFAGEDLDVERVDSLDDALRVLASVGGNGLALPKLDGGAAS